MVRPPEFLRRFFPSVLWKIPVHSRKVFLTFDDGPVPEVTPAVLDVLLKYNAKATFFCIGTNVKKYPEIYQRILSEGHRCGNHTQHHLNAWKVPLTQYLEDIEAASDYIHSDLFRPPYGKITPAIINRIRSSYRIVLWDVISYDFDPSLSSTQVLNNILDHLRPGSIIVLHDSVKAAPRMLPALTSLLEQLQQKGYSCEVLA